VEWFGSAQAVLVSETPHLVSEVGKELRWFCVPCYAVIINPPPDDQVTQALHKLTQHSSQIEEKLDSKVDASKFVSLENMVQGLDTKVEGLAATLQAVLHDKADESQLQEETADKRLEDKVDDVMKAIGSQQLNAAKLLEGAMKTQNEEAREEEEEKRKRKVNVIVHGLKEPEAKNSEDRIAGDTDATKELLHIISCDNVSVKQVTRLRALPTTDTAAKPRPLRIISRRHHVTKLNQTITCLKRSHCDNFLYFIFFYIFIHTGRPIEQN